MKTFLTWLVLNCLLFALVIGGGHYWFSKQPHRVLVAVDTSFSMKDSRTAARNLVSSLDNTGGRYTEYALITAEQRVHGWQKKLDPGAALKSETDFFGPSQFDVLSDEGRYPEVGESDERILVTNAATKPKGLSGWQVKTVR